MPYASSIQVVNDANGTAYAFLADNGLIWQCQWNGAAQRWDKGQAVPGAVGGEKLQALALDNLWPTESGGSSGNATTGNNPGIVLAYRVGRAAAPRSSRASASGAVMDSWAGRRRCSSPTIRWRSRPSR